MCLQTMKIQEEFKEKTSAQKLEHDNKLSKLEKEQQSFWALMNKLNESNTLEVVLFFMVKNELF